MPKISVIIPTYNRASCIAKAIDSALNQTYKNIEILVVDDGSTDNTPVVLKDYMNKIRYFYKDNGGVSSARNFGIRNATGDYISFLDSDDLWEQEKIDIQLNYLLKKENLSAVISDIKFINKYGDATNRTNISTQIPKEGMILKYLVTNFQTMCTILMKKQIFNEVGYFDESLTTAEDIDMLMRIASKYQIGIISMPLVLVNNSASGLSNRLFTGNRLTVIEKLKQYNPQFAAKHKNLVLSAITKINLGYADDLLWHRYIKSARKQVLKSLRNQITIKAVSLYVKSVIMAVASLVLAQYKDKGVFVSEEARKNR